MRNTGMLGLREATRKNRETDIHLSYARAEVPRVRGIDRFRKVFMGEMPYVIFELTSMSERWIQDCKRILDQIKKLDDVKGKDRLDMVRMIRFTLHALQRSVSGWLQWVDNPDIMANFSLEELQEINKNLAKLTRSFVEYDAEITSLTKKDLITKEKKSRKELMERTKDKTEIFYVK